MGTILELACNAGYKNTHDLVYVEVQDIAAFKALSVITTAFVPSKIKNKKGKVRRNPCKPIDAHRIINCRVAPSHIIDML